jgi:GNAT superfamily N-acetyltransferase
MMRFRKTPPRESIEVRSIKPDEVTALAELEAAAWPAPLQAREELIRRRIALGHTIIVAAAQGHLAAASCVIPTTELPHDRARFPRDFESFSSLPRSAPVNSIYAYNLCVHPEHRGETLARDIIRVGIERARGMGARWLVGDGRCPSYAGTDGSGPDRVEVDYEFRAALDAWAATGISPPVEVLIRDPVLRFYYRMLDCEFLHLAWNFLPQDASSGGHRVIFAKAL